MNRIRDILSREEYCNTLFEGDCLDIMEHLPDACVDMVLCDLPYGTTQNQWDSVIPLEKLWPLYRRIVKKNGAIVLTSQGIFTAKLILSNEQDFRYKIIWEKSKPTNFLKDTSYQSTLKNREQLLYIFPFYFSNKNLNKVLRLASGGVRFCVQG